MGMFSWSSIQCPILCLAPMAGYTDSPFRQIVKEICPQAICFTEFTNVDGLLHGNEATLRQVAFEPERQRPIVAQIFGKKPEHFYRAAKLLTELGVDAIDINMGCPAKKIVSSDCGSSLLKNPMLAEEIVKAVIEGTTLPVSVKMRIGITCYDSEYFFDFALRMEAAGAKMLTVHGRISKQMYSGAANWKPIYELKKLLKIPVVGNGDIRSGADAVEKLGDLDGIMVGRASFGNPWIFQEILAAFAKRPFFSPTWEEKQALINRHMELNCKFRGESIGMREMRKHFAWYIRGMPHASDFRQKLVKVTSRKETLSILAELATLINQGLSQAPLRAMPA